MYFDTAFDFDDLPEDDEPDTTLPLPACAPADDLPEEEEEEEPPPMEAAEATLPSHDSGAATEYRGLESEQGQLAKSSSSTVDLGPHDIAAAVVNKHAEECFLIGPHGFYLDEDNGNARMIEWSWACPWTFRSVGTVADQRYLIAQRGFYLVVVGKGEQSFRLAAEPGTHGLWKLEPVPKDPSRCFLQSCQGTYLACLDDKDQTLYMSPNAEEWEQWRCVRLSEPQEPAASPTAAPEPAAAEPPAAGAEGAVVAFGLGDFDVAGLVRGSSPHLPPRPPAGGQGAQEQAAARGAGGKDGEMTVGAKQEPAVEWEGPKANFQVREEVLPMHLEREDMSVQDIVSLWEEWGCKFAGRLKFVAPPDSSVKWIHKSELVPGHPVVVRLEGPGAVLDAVTVALRRNGRKVAEA